MRKMILALATIAISSLCVAQTYTPEQGAKITFKIKNFGSSVEGSMTELDGRLIFEQTSFEKLQVTLTIDAKTIDTGINMRDNHLRKEDYFDVAKYPKIQFVSSQTVKTKSDAGVITGKLTIKKISKEITFPFHYTLINGKPRFKAEVKLNRRDFEVGGSSFSLSDDVVVFIDVPFIKS
jgi:polyisoprenoid-binding protein YceI